MTLQEFLKSHPKFVEMAKKCKSESEFADLAEKNGLRFSKDTLSQTYRVLCQQETGELSDDALKSVAGGVASLNVLPITLGDAHVNIVT